MPSTGRRMKLGMCSIDISCAVQVCSQILAISSAVSIRNQLEGARAELWVWTTSQDPDAGATCPFCSMEEYKVIWERLLWQVANKIPVIYRRAQRCFMRQEEGEKKLGRAQQFVREEKTFFNWLSSHNLGNQRKEASACLSAQIGINLP